MTDKILFVCVENAGSSIMAEAFFKKYSPKNFQSNSAGTKPASQVNPLVVQVMKEVGIDISLKNHRFSQKKMISTTKKLLTWDVWTKSLVQLYFLKI